MKGLNKYNSCWPYVTSTEDDVSVLQLFKLYFAQIIIVTSLNNLITTVKQLLQKGLGPSAKLKRPQN